MPKNIRKESIKYQLLRELAFVQAKSSSDVPDLIKDIKFEFDGSNFLIVNLGNRSYKFDLSDLKLYRKGLNDDDSKRVASNNRQLFNRMALSMIDNWE